MGAKDEVTRGCSGLWNNTIVSFDFLTGRPNISKESCSKAKHDRCSRESKTEFDPLGFMICRFLFVLCSKFLIRLNPHSFLSAERMKALAFSCQVLHHLFSKLAVLFYQQWGLDECPISAIWNSLFEIRSVNGNFPESMCSRALDAAWDSTQLCANVLVSW